MDRATSADSQRENGKAIEFMESVTIEAQRQRSARTPVLKREFGDPALVETAEAERDHALVLLFRCGGERQIEASLRAENPRDGGILGGMSPGKIAIVRAVLHVLAVGLQHLRVGAGLTEHFAQHFEI